MPEPTAAVPVSKAVATIMGRAQLDTWEAMCALRGRAPHELASDLVLAAIRWGQHDHETQALVAAVRAYGRGRLLYQGPRSSMGRREMTGILDGDPPDGDDKMAGAIAAGLSGGRIP
jgi:hypothetical protein